MSLSEPAGSGREAEVLPDVLGESVVDFGVAGDRLFPACSRIHVDVMATAMAMQRTAIADELPDEFGAFQTAICLVW
jgi:hypothetical protein